MTKNSFVAKVTFKELSVAKNCPRTGSAPLKKKDLLIDLEFFCLHSNIKESIPSSSIEKSFLPSCFETRSEGFLWIKQRR